TNCASIRRSPSSSTRGCLSERALHLNRSVDVHVRLGPQQDRLRQGEVEDTRRNQQNERQLQEQRFHRLGQERRDRVRSLKKNAGAEGTYNEKPQRTVGFGVCMLAAMCFAFITSLAHAVSEPRKDDHERNDENEKSGDEPSRMSNEPVAALHGNPGKVIDSQDGIDECDQPAAACPGFKVNANVSNGVFGVHGFPSCGDGLPPYICSLNGFSGSVEKIASMGRSKYAAMAKASFRLGP